MLRCWKWLGCHWLLWGQACVLVWKTGAIWSSSEEQEGGERKGKALQRQWDILTMERNATRPVMPFITTRRLVGWNEERKVAIGKTGLWGSSAFYQALCGSFQTVGPHQCVFQSEKVYYDIILRACTLHYSRQMLLTKRLPRRTLKEVQREGSVEYSIQLMSNRWRAEKKLWRTYESAC